MLNEMLRDKFKIWNWRYNSFLQFSWRREM